MQDVGSDAIYSFARAVADLQDREPICVIDGYPFFARDLVFRTALDLHREKWGNMPFSRIIEGCDLLWRLRHEE